MRREGGTTDKVKKVMLVFGTRPETTKMAPLIVALQKSEGLQPFVCVLRQHDEVPNILASFGLAPDANIAFPIGDRGVFAKTKNPFKKLWSLFRAGAGFLRFYRVLKREKPDMVVVQGDTSTAFLAAFMAHNMKIPVAHVEAGLRTHNKWAPFPEEMNRQLIGRIADYHFAPTERARENLLREDIPAENIFVTGNTALDAVRIISEETRLDSRTLVNARQGKLIIVTAHRRESFGEGIARICDALRALAERRNDVVIVYPVHPNPNVHDVVYEKLAGLENVQLVPPMSYEKFIPFLKRAYLVLTDSGGLQEELSFLGKPGLVMRDVTERQEGVEAGNVKLVGTDVEKIVSETVKLLDDPAAYAAMARAHTAFGDGHAAEKIAGILEKTLGADQS